MLTLVWFIGITTAIGAVGYFSLRPLVLAHWDRWQEDRAQTREMEQRVQQRQVLRDEAASSVLRQLAQQEEAMRPTRRKAA